MPSRTGIGVNNVPFEKRYPDPRRRKREPLTRGDRLVLALCGSLLGLFLWSTLYLILAFIGLRTVAKVAALPPPAVAAPPIDPMGHLPPYWWGTWPALLFAGYGSLVGAERMMDGFEWVMWQLGKFADAASRED